MIRSPQVILRFHVGFLFHSVQVLIQPVQEVGYQFLRIVLLVTLELWLEFPNSSLEGEGGMGSLIAEPHAFDEVCEL